MFCAGAIFIVLLLELIMFVVESFKKNSEILFKKAVIKGHYSLYMWRLD